MSTMQKTLGTQLSEALHRASHDLAQEIAYDEPPSSFTNPRQRAEMLEKQTNEALEALCYSFVEAKGILTSSLEFLAHKRSDFNLEKVLSELTLVVSLANKAIFESFALLDHEEEASQLPEVSEETFSVLYDACASLMQEKRFNDLVKVFSLLCSARVNDYDYWIGYGHAAYHAKQYDTAVQAYYMAATLSGENPWPMVWAANACEANQNIDASIDLLTQAHEFALDKHTSDMSALAHDIHTRLSHLSSQKRGGIHEL